MVVVGAPQEGAQDVGTQDQSSSRPGRLEATHQPEVLRVGVIGS